MTEKIDLQPAFLDLILYAGDGFPFKITCKDSDEEPIPVTGTVTAQIRSDRLTPDASPLVSFTVDLDESDDGIIRLSLTGDQTAALVDDNGTKGKFKGVWDVEWDPIDEEPHTLVQGNVLVMADVTRDEV